jgi:hypothetical protein
MIYFYIYLISKIEMHHHRLCGVALPGDTCSHDTSKPNALPSPIRMLYTRYITLNGVSATLNFSIDTANCVNWTLTLLDKSGNVASAHGTTSRTSKNKNTPVAPVTTPVAPVTTPVAPVTTPVAPVTTPVAPVTTPVAPVTTPVAPTPSLSDSEITATIRNGLTKIENAVGVDARAAAAVQLFNYMIDNCVPFIKKNKVLCDVVTDKCWQHILTLPNIDDLTSVSIRLLKATGGYWQRGIYAVNQYERLNLMRSIFRARNLNMPDTIMEEYDTWCKNTTLPPRTNRYQRMIQFINTRTP